MKTWTCYVWISEHWVLNPVDRIEHRIEAATWDDAQAVAATYRRSVRAGLAGSTRYISGFVLGAKPVAVAA